MLGVSAVIFSSVIESVSAADVIQYKTLCAGKKPSPVAFLLKKEIGTY